MALIMQLPKSVCTTMTLKHIVSSLPEPFQLILGDIDFPTDDGKDLAIAIASGTATLYDPRYH